MVRAVVYEARVHGFDSSLLQLVLFLSLRARGGLKKMDRDAINCVIFHI